MEPPTLQLVDGAGAYDRDGFASFCRDVALPERGLSYAVVAIMGPQSSGELVRRQREPSLTACS